MIDTQQYIKINIRGEISIIVVQAQLISISIDDQHFSKFFLFSPLIFETSSVCGPFLICTSVFSQAPGSRNFLLK
jgi:hypothetical protein